MMELAFLGNQKNFLFTFFFILMAIGSSGFVQNWHSLTYDSSKIPDDNPLKGFMPYVGEYNFPYSLEYFYIGMAEIVTGPGQYDWQQKLEPTLNEIANRGHQAVFRIYLEYPRRPLQVPQFILDTDIKITPYETFGG